MKSGDDQTVIHCIIGVVQCKEFTLEFLYSKIVSLLLNNNK